MSAIENFKTYYSATSALTSLIPVARVFNQYLPPTNTAYPYAVIIPLGTTTDWLTAHGVDHCRFQISIYDTSAANVETILDGFETNLNWKQISADCCGMERTNRMSVPEDEQPTAGTRVYHSFLEYDYRINTVS